MRRLALLAACASLSVLLATGGVSAQTAGAAPGLPTNLSATATGGSLTVTWSAPTADGGATITSYDLQYTEGDGATNAIWTVLDDVWTEGSLSYVVSGLKESTGYAVQVRAVNSDGDGGWSDPPITQTTTDHGGTQGTATPAALGDDLPGTIDPPEDVDFFSFTIDATTGTTDVWLYTTGDTDTHGYLYNSGGTTLEGEFGDSGNPNNHLNFEAWASLPPGTYYVSVETFEKSSSGSYTLHVRSVAPVGTSRGTATEITPTSEGSLFPGFIYTQAGYNYFKFELTSSADVFITTTGGLDTAAELQRHNVGYITQSGDSFLPVGSLRPLIRERLAAGTYYIEVELYGSAPPHTGPYSLFIQLVPDRGTSIQGATEIPLWSTRAGNISSSGGHNYFKFALDNPLWVRLTASSPDVFSDVLSLTWALFDASSPSTDISSSLYDDSQPRRQIEFSSLGYLLAGTYYFRVTSEVSDEQLYALQFTVSEDDQALLNKCQELGESPPAAGRPVDPLYNCQWHLNNFGQFGGAGQDINVEEAWGTTMGEGITVRVVDDGVNGEHLDLSENFLTYAGEEGIGGGDGYGTRVAGVIAARDNDRGGRGVAPRASIYSYKLPAGEPSDPAVQDAIQLAMVHDLAGTAVSNNHWGILNIRTDMSPRIAPAGWEVAIEKGVTEGFGGKGISYVTAGASSQSNADANLDEYGNHYGVITVCAVSRADTLAGSSSAPGANLWLCAPAGRDSPAITTTDLGSYTERFSDTPAAAPIVSGVVALMRSANMNLTWRDVKLILAASARKNHDVADSGWEQGALRYGSDTDYYWFSHKYGFGVVDAGAAVALAAGWSTLPDLPELRELTLASQGAPVSIPDAPAGGGFGETVTTSIVVDTDYVGFIEFVEINLDIDHDSYTHLQIDLVSPSGATSQLARTAAGYTARPLRESFRLGSARHLGEESLGTWTLHIKDGRRQNTGTLNSWSLTFYGQGEAPEKPTIHTATTGDTSLNVSWNPPTVTAAFPVTSYDLRYIASDAADKSHSNWTLNPGIWSAGVLSYDLTGLTRGVEYDLQVRAVSADGAGLWSDVFNGHTTALPPGPPANLSVNPRDLGLGVVWNEPAFTGGELITDYDLRHIASDAPDKADSFWMEHPRVGIANGDLFTHNIESLTNGISYDVQARATTSAGTGEWSSSVLGTPHVQNTDAAFPATENGMRDVDEHSEVGVRVGSAVAASDDDGDPLMYSIVDNTGTFTIEEVTGQILVNDAVALLVDATFTVTVQVSDQRNSSGDVDPTIDAHIDVTITVLDVNDPPVVSGSDDIEWPETDSGVLEQYTAVDPENEPIRWGLDGLDRDKFTISDQGELTFHSDYEVDYDSGQQTFLVRVVAFDGELRTSYLVMVRLTDVDEAPGIGVADEKADYPENGIERVAAFLGLDPEGEVVSWELSGDDAGAFQIEIQIFTIQPVGVLFPFGVLDFLSPPDYEAPTDVGEDNIYHATVRALDPQGHSAEYDLIVTVTDVANAVNVSFSDATYDVPEGDNVEVTVTLSADPDQTVVIPLTAAGRGGLEDADYSGVPANVTFSAGGSLEQRFSVTTTDDRINDDGESLRLTFGTLPDSVTSTSPSSATVSITDDDVAGVTLSETSLDIAEGGSGSYTLVLTSEPTADVTIESRAPASSDLTVNPSSLTFTSGDWESSQTVAVSAADDNDFTDDTGTITHRVTSGDSDYNNRSIGSVAVTVLDDEEVPVTVKFGRADYTVAEGGTVDVTVTLNRDPKRTLAIPIEKTNRDGAVDGDDYSGVPSSVTFDSGDRSKTIIFEATQDDLDDDGESVRLSFGALTDVTAVTAVTPSASTISITDDDHPIVDVSFEKDTYDVNEGGSVDVKLMLNEAPGRSVTIQIDKTEMDATIADYSVPGAVTFGPNDTEQSISFRTTQDSINDDDESVRLELSSTLPDRVEEGTPSEATVSITDDDGPGVLITPTTLTVPEGRSRTYTVKLTSQPRASADVTVTISAPVDSGVTHDATDDMLTFTAANWATNQTVRVSAEDDDDHLDETATILHTVASTDDSDYNGLSASDVDVTVTDDEGVPVEVSFKESNYPVDEGDTVDVTVTLNRDPERTVVISITKTNQGGAVNGDYRGVPSSVTFRSGDTEQTFTVTTVNDTIDDDDESVQLSFGMTLPEAVTRGSFGEATIEIMDDDDPQVTVSFKESSYRVAEGESVEVTVTLSPDPERRVMIGISATGQDGATEQNNTGADYSGVPPSLTFNDGETEKSFTITAVNDTGDDDGESILLGFGNVPTGVTRGTGVTVTIEDDDVPDVVVSFEKAAYAVDEDGSVTVKVKLDRDPERQVVIPITRSNRGGASTQDYSGVPARVTFESDETEQDIRFSATHDTLNDDDESVVIGFGSSLPLQVMVTGGMTSSTTVTIVDDDAPNVTVNFEQTSYDVAEGAEVEVEVTLSGDPERSVTIPITATGQGGATSNDYAINPPSLTFESGGEMSKLLTFSATDDGVDDDGESVKLVFGSVAGVTRGVRSEATVTIEDNPDDVPAVTVNFARSSYTAAEDQTAANHTVEVELTLSPAPEREVVIPIVRTNERNASDADYVPLPTTVTFASDETEQTLTFTPVDDAIDDDGERVRLALGAPPRLVSRGTTRVATVSITDNDTRGVTVRPTSLRINEGATGEYTVVLGSEPTAEVTVTIDAPTNTDITVDRPSLTFTSSNWSSPQRVEASGSEDTDDADDTGTITHTVRSSGDYAGVRADPVSVTVLDDEDRQVRVEFDRETGTVAEGGGAITFTVTLSADPQRTITIPIRVTHHSGASSLDYTLSVDGVAATSVTFSSGDRSKQITLTAVDDMFDDDDESVTLGFGGLPGGVAAGTVNEVTVSITDTDDPSVTARFERTTYTIDEGDSFSINVILSPDPERTVTIPIAITIEDADGGRWGLPEDVTFNDGETTKSIKFTATNDDVDDDNGRVIVRFDTSSLDNVSAGNETTVRITDNDTRGVTVTPAVLTVDEGLSDSYDVVLTSQPTGDVMVTIGAPANTDITVSTAELTFTASDWDMPQSVTVSAAADDMDAEDDTGTITHDVSGGDYGSVSADPVSVTVDDDEVSVSFERAAYAAAEGGDAVTVTVRLSAPAKETFVIDLVKTEDGATEDDDYSALPDRLEFEPGETEQSFGFSALADTEADDGESVLLGFAMLPPGVIAGEPAQATLTISNVIRSTGLGGVGGGGGGGGGPSGPSPSKVEFEWNVTRDIETLDSGHDAPTGAWSDGTLLWIAENGDGADDAVYAYDLVTGERVEDREFGLHETNRAPRGLWSNSKTAWVADSGQNRLFAYDLESGERDEEREVELDTRNRDARGIWSDDETMWVLDGGKNALFGYDLESGELIAEHALDSGNDDPRGLWSDGVTIWVSDHGAKRLFAYRIPQDGETASEDDAAEEEDRGLERVIDEEFKDLPKASNNSPRGIWSDGDVMYVADESDAKVYSYNLPDAIDARLASLTLSGVDIGEFSSRTEEYAGVLADGVTETTVAAEATQRRASVSIEPPDANQVAEGHQVAIEDVSEITVTVTSADGSRTKDYLVRFGDAAEAEQPVVACLRGAVTVGFSLLIYGGGSVDDLVACAQSRSVTALYVPHEGEYVSYILGAPAFVNEEFVALYRDGLPALAPLIAKSAGPPSPAPPGDDVPEFGPECLRGAIATGFSLVLYEGGSVEALDTCAQGRDVSAVYALVDGEWVSYILGAPAFVNAAFRELFADGLAPATPLVAKSD